MTETAQVAPPGRAPAGVWWSMCAGPVAWAFDLGLSYILEQHSCSTGHHYVLHVISIVCFVVALTGLVAAWSLHNKLPNDASDKGRRPVDREHFQILFGIVFSLSFAMVIIAGAVPRWILNVCQ